MLNSLYLRVREYMKAKSESGQGMVEYALILVLIAVVVIAVLSQVGQKVNSTFSNINSGLH